MFAALLLCLFLSQVSGDCLLDGTKIAQTNRIFAFRADSQIYPLRLDTVRTHQSLEMLCKGQDVVHATCKPNGKLNPPLPITDCESPTKATVEVVNDNSCPYTMYRVGYKLDAQQFLELYRSCYSPNDQAVKFVIHVTYPSRLTNRPTQGFTLDGVLSGALEASFLAKNIYKRFEELLGSTQRYIDSERTLVFDRGHLAPSADFGFDQYARQTFKYINVVPQYRRINRSNWKIIENWVRKQLNDGRFAALSVCTGGLDVLQLPDSSGRLHSMYLFGTSQNPIPKWLFKIVSDGAGTRYAFINYNNVDDKVEPTPICNKVLCPSTLQLNEAKNSGFTYCCDPSDFISRNAPHLAQVC